MVGGRWLWQIRLRYFKRTSNAPKTHLKRISNAPETLPQTHLNTFQRHLKRTTNAPQTHFKRTSNAPQTQLKHTSNAPQRKLKINKFTKSPSSKGGIPIVRFLLHMAIIKDQKITIGDGNTAEVAKFH